MHGHPALSLRANRSFMKTIPYILATAGHVDHGKSALVRALTGIDPDRLPEEKARGITIDLGFANLNLSSPPSVDPPVRYHVGVVDVPGHEDFVKNMVAGIGSVDAALLVVAADDGWMPQTEEHLQILGYLGVTRGVVALTKIDLAQDEAALRLAVREKLKESALAQVPIVATSVVSGRGMEDLKRTLAEVLSNTPSQRGIGKPRLPVDRVFTLKGIGTVVTGTLTGGRLSRGQVVIAQPAGKTVRIRNVQTHNRDVAAGEPGSRVALNLPDLVVDDGHSAHGDAVVRRGDTITLPDLGRPFDIIDVLLERSPRLPRDRAPVLKDGALVHVHHGSGDFTGKVHLARDRELRPGQRCVAQLRLQAPLLAFVGDRMIVRDWPAQHTLAGAVVLDPDAVRRGYRTEERRRLLEARAASLGQATPLVEVQLSTDGAVARAGLLAKTRFSKDEIAAGVSELIAADKAVAVGDIIASSGWWANMLRRAADAIAVAQRDHPEQPGLKLTDLRQSLAPMPGAAAFEAIVAKLAEDGYVRSGAVIRKATHRPTLPPRLEPAGARLRNALAAAGMEPPSRKELAPDSVSQQALHFLLESGEAVEVGEQVVLGSEPFTRALNEIRQFISRHGPATVSDLKQAVGSSRRIMVPFLEKLDRDGVTRREGDRRVLRSPSQS